MIDDNLKVKQQKSLENFNDKLFIQLVSKM